MPPKRHELLALGELILIEDHLLRRVFLDGIATRLLTAEDWILLSGLSPRVVEEIALAEGHANVGLLDMAHHFAVELLL